MRRREFIALFGGAAAAGAWPIVASAQQADRIRRIGVLLSIGESDRDGQLWLIAFRHKLSELGWVDGRNVRVDYRFTSGTTELMRSQAVELANLRPDVVLVAGTPVVAASRPLLRSIPVVFVQVTDPVGTGFVESLAHPGGNMTGFTSFEYSMAGKWLELLNEVQPALANVVMIENPDNANHKGYLRATETAASTLHVGVIAADVRSAAEIKESFETFARKPGIGIIVPPDSFTLSQRSVIVDLTIKYRLAAVYAFPPFVRGGGLLSYGVDNNDMYLRAASYVDRILRGEKPAELPVQASNKFVLLINLNAANAIGLTVPPALLSRADEVIE